jgi:hypothetical protein
LEIYYHSLIVKNICYQIKKGMMFPGAIIFFEMGRYTAKPFFSFLRSVAKTPISMLCYSVRGVAQHGLARLPWEQEAAGSNPVAPTI